MNKYILEKKGAEIDAALDKAGVSLSYEAQELTLEQQAQARENIGVGSGVLGGLRGGTKGQITAKASDADYDFEFVDPPANATYIFDIAKLKEKSLLNITTGDVEQTGNEVYPYSVKFVQQLNYGKTDQITGELTSYVNADLGIKYYKRIQWEPTTLGGCLDVRFVGDNLSIGYPHKLQNVISTVMGANIIINSQVELVQKSNRQYIEITTTANFPNSPTEVNINNIKDYLNGDVNARGRYAKEIYIRVEVIDTKEVKVL